MFLLVRHGQSTWNAEHRWAGQSDPPLTDLGRQQAADLGRALIGVGISRVVASDLRRAHETAEIVATRLGTGEVEVVPGLRERWCGEWEGRTTEEIDASHPGLLARWRVGEVIDGIAGESHVDFDRRVGTALASLTPMPGARTLIVAHAGVLRILSFRLGISLAEIANTSGIWFETVNGSPANPQIFDPHDTTSHGTIVGGVSDASDSTPDRNETTATDHGDVVDLDLVERNLAAVESALARLSDGTYWTDEVTGDPIPDHVLAIDPTARRA